MAWMEIIDSAVKIGLGALISSVATYLSLLRTHKHEIAVSQAAERGETRKAYLSERAAILKDIALKVEKCSSYLNVMQQALTKSPKTSDELLEMLRELTAAFNEAKEARSFCYLTGNKALGALLTHYLENMSLLTSHVKLSKGMLDISFLKTNTEARNAIKDQILDNLGRSFESLYA